jgi:hypothetical protein
MSSADNQFVPHPRNLKRRGGAQKTNSCQQMKTLTVTVCFAVVCGVQMFQFSAESWATPTTIIYGPFSMGDADHIFTQPEVIQTWTDPDPIPPDDVLGNHYYLFEKYRWTVTHEVTEPMTTEIKYDPDYQRIVLMTTSHSEGDSQLPVLFRYSLTVVQWPDWYSEYDHMWNPGGVSYKYDDADVVLETTSMHWQTTTYWPMVVNIPDSGYTLFLFLSVLPALAFFSGVYRGRMW